MPEVLEWQGADPGELVRRCAQVLAQGQSLALPTAVGYDIISNLSSGLACDGQTVPLLLLSDSSQLANWIPALPAQARRLARRCWPGPLTLVCDVEQPHAELTRLDDLARRRLCPEGTLHARVPSSHLLRQLLDEMRAPLLSFAIDKSGADGHWGRNVALVVDDARLDEKPTIVRVNSCEWTVLGEGALTREELVRQSCCVIVFVCTGNTCRSPLAEALLKERLAEVLGCAVDELPRRGFVVLSAGLAAIRGVEASGQAVEVAREYGADLSIHSSQPVTPDLVGTADYLLAMTQSHLRLLQSLHLGECPRPRLLSRDGTDITDPIGASLADYRFCAEQIHLALTELLLEMRQNGDLPTSSTGVNGT
jgi:L-threonylcarbamoyladenylate synthase